MMTEVVIPLDHASFAGHFPGNPILPGVLLLERIMSYAQSQLNMPLQSYTLLNVKFLSAVSPGDKISLAFAESNSNEKHFSVHILQNGISEHILACTGKLRFNAAS